MPGLAELTLLVWVILSVVFVVVVGWVLYGLWRKHGHEISALSGRRRQLFFGGGALALLTLVATPFLLSQGGALVLVWLLLLGASTYAVFKAISGGY